MTGPPPGAKHPHAAPFYEGARRGVLMIQRCGRCGKFQFALPGRTAGIGRCRTCGTAAPEWVPSSGGGVLVSHTMIPDRDDRPARLAGIVQLNEGPWVHAAIEADPEGLRAGVPMAAGFSDDPGLGVPVPVFRLQL